MESRPRIRVDRAGRVFHFSQMVVIGFLLAILPGGAYLPFEAIRKGQT
jgi:hypothetical protein